MAHQRSDDERLDDCYQQAQEMFQDAAEVRRTGNTVLIAQSLVDAYRIIMDLGSRGELQIEDEWYRPNTPEHAEKFATIFQAHTEIFTKGLIQMNVYRSKRGEHYGSEHGFHGFLYGRLDTDIWKYELPVLRTLHDGSVEAIKKILAPKAGASKRK